MKKGLIFFLGMLVVGVLDWIAEKTAIKWAHFLIPVGAILLIFVFIKFMNWIAEKTDN